MQLPPQAAWVAQASRLFRRGARPAAPRAPVFTIGGLLRPPATPPGGAQPDKGGAQLPQDTRAEIVVADARAARDEQHVPRAPGLARNQFAERVGIVG